MLSAALKRSSAWHPAISVPGICGRWRAWSSPSLLRKLAALAGSVRSRGAPVGRGLGTPAREYLEAALAFNPSDAEASALMGYILVVQGRSREALPYLRSAMKDPKCASRRTIRQLLARAEGRPADEPEDVTPLPGKPQAAGEGESPYTVAKPTMPS